MDATLDRLLRHMAWANHSVMTSLSALSATQLELHVPGSDWTVARIASHLVDAQRWYVWRLAGDVCEDLEVPVNPDEFGRFAKLLTIADARIREEAVHADATVTYVRDGKTIIRRRSTVIAQAIHHCTEHRAQIADVLSAHGLSGIDLDELDLWSFGSFEGLNI